MGLETSIESGDAGATPLPRSLFLGFAIASIGGPIALLSIFPGAAGDGVDSAGLVILLALAVFAAPVWIWVSYSARVASPGGLSAFVEAAAGRRAAVAHGWIWALAYFLYLPYTITQVVYDVLTPVFPGIRPYRSTFELVLPVLIVLLVLLPVRLVLVPLGVLAVAQLAAMAVVAWFTYRHTTTTFASSPTVNDVGRATGSTALLFVCASLPLYLGAEVRGTNRTVRRVLVAAVSIVGLVFFVSALPFSGVPDELRDSAVPGAAIAQAYCGRALAVTVGLLTALSILALIVAEYVALARLLHWLHGPPVRTLVAWIAVPFLAADAISLVNPERFYSDLLKPSLGALFVSQLIVFGLFPRFRRGPLALAAAAVAFALAGWGLYTLIWGGAST